MRVAVLSGGRSGEHDISLASGEAVRAGLANAGHEALDIRISRAGAWEHDGTPVVLEPAGGLLGADVAFPVLHGPYGEDGTVQGALEVLGVPYVGAGVAASAIAMDKVLFKDLAGHAGLPQVDYVALRPDDDQGSAERLGLPVFVKPARLGSSVGIAKATTAEELEAAVAGAFAHDDLVIVEAFSSGLEVECGVLGNDEPQTSDPGEIVIDAEWYDFEAKYQPGGMQLLVPARVPQAVAARVRELAVAAFRLVGCAGLARVDFFVEEPDGEARVLLNELNTMPGFTQTSVYAKLFEAGGVAYEQLLERLLELALARHGER